MSFTRYPKYKDSGVEWLGELPDGWEVRRLKEVADVFPSSVDKKEYDDEIPVSLCNYTDVYYNDLILAEMTFMKATASSRQIERFELRKGDVLLTKDSETAEDIARSAYVPENLPGVVCGYHLSIARSNEELKGAFLKYAFDTSGVRAQAEVSANGLTRVGLSQSAMGCLRITLPPCSEQASIVDFLNRETAKMDALIEEQRRLIELLREKRQAVISHAVTRGLQHDVPLRTSEFTWIGKVPQSWNIARLRTVADVRGGITKNAAAGTKERQVPYLRVANVQNGYLDLQEVATVGATDTQLERYRLEPGDLLMNEGGDFDKLGRGAIWVGHISDCIHQNHVFAVRAHAVEPEWLALVTQAECGKFYFMSRSKQSTNLASISQSNIRELPIPLPFHSEQQDIIKFVRAEISALDGLEQEATRATQLLQERRSALISAAVTGKIEVRLNLRKPVQSTWNSSVARSVLAAAILTEAGGQETGRIKAQKLIHLCEYHAQLDEIEGRYMRKPAGPFDAELMQGVRSALLERDWFEEYKDGHRYAYRPLQKVGGHLQELQNWKDQLTQIRHVLSLLAKSRQTVCERVSTLYAAWNDLLIEGKQPSDEDIIFEASSAERWHKRKEKIASEKWRASLQWMRQNALVPVGWGAHTGSESAAEVEHGPA